MLIFAIAVLALLGWIGAGMLLFFRYSRPAGTDLQRSVSRGILETGAALTVSLRTVPPWTEEREPEPHDVVLILDHSVSMGDGPGSPLREAIRAAENFVRRCPSSVHIGLIAFDDAASPLIPISADHDAVLRGLSTIGAGGGTSIHAGLAEAAEVIRSAPDRAVPRTAILLSDGGSNYNLARREAERLRALCRIVAIGFGAGADATLLRELAGGEGHFCSVAGAEDLFNLFAQLATYISSGAASGLLQETVQAPAPFQITNTGPLHPVSFGHAPEMTVTWSVPVLERTPVVVSYDLVPDCPGWHSVARSGAQVTWRLPDGTEQARRAPAGPRVLVLPVHFAWAWPVLNPLFWLLFGRFFCNPPQPAAQWTAQEPEPLPLPSLPRLLEPPQPPLYEPSIKPAVVIGIGKTGEWAACHVKHMLADRRAGGVSVLAVRVPLDVETQTMRVGAVGLEPAETLHFSQDFRPYLESLRDGGPPPHRRWIPVREWLAKSGPRTSVWTRDRREARLALLQRPQEFESRLHELIVAAKALDPEAVAVIVGSVEDPECSGLLAEVAHALAVDEMECTAVLTAKRNRAGGGEDVEAFSREIERMLLMRGDSILSDRREPPVPARRLLDRLVIMNSTSRDPRHDGEEISAFVWELLACREAILPEVPTTGPSSTGREAECCLVQTEHVMLPAESLWEWVRMQSLTQAINGVWLNLRVVENRLDAPAPLRQDVERWVTRFWTASGFTRPPGLLVTSAGAISNTTLTESMLMTVFARVPSGALYGEQVAFANRERLMFAAFTEEWVQTLLSKAYEDRQWGLPLLLAALREIEDGVEMIQRRLREFSGNPRAGHTARLASSLYNDFSAHLDELRRSAEDWCRHAIGNHAALGIFGASGEPLSLRLEHARAIAEMNVLFPSEDVREDVLRRAFAWYQQYGSALIRQLRLIPVRQGQSARIALQLGDKTISDESQLWTELVDGFMHRYRAEVLSWPLADRLPDLMTNPASKFGIGMHAPRVYPGLRKYVAERDPCLAAAVGVECVSVMTALGVSPVTWKRLPFAWPEEANAARIAALIQNLLDRQPEPLSPVAVHLLRDTDALKDFFADVAENRIVIRGSRCVLQRNGHDYEVGASPAALNAGEALRRIQDMARQVALLKESIDHQPIPDRAGFWSVSPEEAVQRVEASAVVQSVTTAEEWLMWRDVIRGLALDGYRSHGA